MAEEAAQAPLTINSQYVKDHSFENPNAPSIYGTMRKESPQLNVNVEVTPSHLQGAIYEVVLGLRAEAKIGETTAFLAEIDYAAVVTIAETLDEKVREQMLMIEVPRFLFPFARAILADDTRDGGFPPLIMNPIDFGQMYLSRKMAQANEGTGEDAGEASAEGGADERPEAADDGKTAADAAASANGQA